MPNSEGGSLVVVGCGIQPPRHASRRTVSEISGADVVFALADAFALDWIGTLHADVRNLGEHYDERRDRRESYRAMEEDILAAVRAGRRVCAVFYGHPSVYVQVGRKTLAAARSEGYGGRMEPGISAEACLYADLELDPGEHGVQSFEATQFLTRRRIIDPSALLLLWQVSLAGNVECVGFEPDRDRLRLLVEKLSGWYELATEVVLYEAATLPVETFRADRIALSALPEAQLSGATTLVIPPARTAEPDRAVLRRLSGRASD